MSLSLSSYEFEYDGLEHCPLAAVSDAGVPLVENVDFTISYASNVYPGTGFVSVVGMGRYSGLSLTADFRIVRSSGNELSLPGTWVKGSQGWWYRCIDSTYPMNCWLVIDGVRYRFDSAGWMLSGWQLVDNAWYWLPSGHMKTGWQQVNGSWYLLGPDGRMTTGWQSVDGTWYWLGSNGRMTTGWQNVNGSWYWLPGGHMATGWQKVNGYWYWLGSNGRMTTGWQSVDGTWYWLGSNGRMTTGWQNVNGSWYWLPGGHMATGWQKVNGYWYWLGSNGCMTTGWQSIDGYSYYFDSSGHMLRDSWVGNYYVGDDGKWDPSRKPLTVYYVPGSEVYHTHWCRTMGSVRNYRQYDSIDKALRAGAKRECKNCAQMG